MVKKIKWTREAEETFDLTIVYLTAKWTDKEVTSFINHTERVLRFISENPFMFRISAKKNVHEAVITTHNLLLYRIKPAHIELITFFDTRQNPLKKHRRKK